MSDPVILIPARSGSTRVKNKNLRDIGRKPLVAYAIESALESRSGRVVVSTNCETIAAIAKDYGAEVPFLRPKEHATATASSLSVLMHFYDWVVDRDEALPDAVAYRPPTNPFLSSGAIEAMCARLADRGDANAIATVTRPKTHPFKIVRVNQDGLLDVGAIAVDGLTIKDVERSQDYPVVWEGSPACRIVRSTFFDAMRRGQAADNFLSVDYSKTYDVDTCLPYEIDPIEAIDIDSESDMVFAEFLLRARASQDDKHDPTTAVPPTAQGTFNA